MHRTWDPRAHPEWLVFEVEGQFQIRPQQHAVASYMIEHPGCIVQLNMGEGKTRVILPMLALHWGNGHRASDSRSAPVVGAEREPCLWCLREPSSLDALTECTAHVIQLQVRLSLLYTLLDEAYSHLHRYLCASVLERRLYRMPFHRDIQVTQEQAEDMAACMRHCQKVGAGLRCASSLRFILV